MTTYRSKHKVIPGGTWHGSRIRQARIDKDCETCSVPILSGEAYLDYRVGTKKSLYLHLACALEAKTQAGDLIYDCAEVRLLQAGRELLVTDKPRLNEEKSDADTNQADR